MKTAQQSFQPIARENALRLIGGVRVALLGRICFSLFLSLFALAARSGSPMLDTPFGSVELGSVWAVESQPDPGVYQLVAESYRTAATIAGKRWRKKPDDLKVTAAEYLKLRRSVEAQMAQEYGRTQTIHESLKEQPYGYQIELWGQDSEGRQFRYWAIVGSVKVVEIYMETYSQSEVALEEIFRTFLKGLHA